MICQPCKERRGVEVRAVRDVAGTPMCKNCLGDTTGGHAHNLKAEAEARRKKYQEDEGYRGKMKSRWHDKYTDPAKRLAYLAQKRRRYRRDAEYRQRAIDRYHRSKRAKERAFLASLTEEQRKALKLQAERDRIADLKRRNLCVRCGSKEVPAYLGTTVCKEHLEMYRDRGRKERNCKPWAGNGRPPVETYALHQQ